MAQAEGLQPKNVCPILLETQLIPGGEEPKGADNPPVDVDTGCWDLTRTAALHSQLAGVLAGVAFAGLAILFGGARTTPKRIDGRLHGPTTKEMVSRLLVAAIGSLTIGAFQWGLLAGDSKGLARPWTASIGAAFVLATGVVYLFTAMVWMVRHFAPASTRTALSLAHGVAVIAGFHVGASITESGAIAGWDEGGQLTFVGPVVLGALSLVAWVVGQGRVKRDPSSARLSRVDRRVRLSASATVVAGALWTSVVLNVDDDHALSMPGGLQSYGLTGLFVGLELVLAAIYVYSMFALASVLPPDPTADLSMTQIIDIRALMEKGNDPSLPDVIGVSMARAKVIQQRINSLGDTKDPARILAVGKWDGTAEDEPLAPGA